MSCLVVAALALCGASEAIGEVIKVGPIEWLRVMGQDSFDYCIAHPHQPDARFDILSDDVVPTEKGATVRVKRQRVTWDGDTATVRDLGEITVRLADLDAEQVTKNALPCDQSRLIHPGLWQVRVSLPAHDGASETPDHAICMTFEGPGKAWTATRAWKDAITIGGWKDEPSASEKRKPWPPADEGSMEPSFKAFRDELHRIVARKDVDALMEAMDPGCKLSFDDQDGRNDLDSEWNPGSPETELWTTLREVLGNGGMFYRGIDRYYKGGHLYDYPAKGYLLLREPETPSAFEAPHWAHAPGWYLDVAVIDENVPVYAAQDTSSEVLWTLSYEVVPGEWDFDPPSSGDWVIVKRGEKTGYVQSSKVRSPVGYRAVFGRGEDGDWKMVFFLAGD
ncbi:MAG: hypothetical protein GY851_02000 [bacterium]|nr:hypothetical protein [bacterium]